MQFNVGKHFQADLNHINKNIQVLTRFYGHTDSFSLMMKMFTKCNLEIPIVIWVQSLHSKTLIKRVASSS